MNHFISAALLRWPMTPHLVCVFLCTYVLCSLLPVDCLNRFVTAIRDIFVYISFVYFLLPCAPSQT